MIAIISADFTASIQSNSTQPKMANNCSHANCWQALEDKKTELRAMDQRLCNLNSKFTSLEMELIDAEHELEKSKLLGLASHASNLIKDTKLI